MNYSAFTASLKNDQVPRLSTWLQALWYDAKGDWEKAHTLIQDLTDNNSSWIHAYLHRKEGDAFNAGYWYRKAGKKMPEDSLEKEWEQIVKELLS
jgi:hypothetical protein